MTAITLRDIRALRAHARRYAHETGCTELKALLTLCEWLGAVDPTYLSPQLAAWITEAYVALTHEITLVQRELRSTQSAEPGAPALTRTVAGVKLTNMVDILDDLEEQPAKHGLPSGVRWSSRVSRLPDAWIGSLHVERYRLDFWGPAPLVEHVFRVVERQLFP